MDAFVEKDILLRNSRKYLPTMGFITFWNFFIETNFPFTTSETMSDKYL